MSSAKEGSKAVKKSFESRAHLLPNSLLSLQPSLSSLPLPPLPSLSLLFSKMGPPANGKRKRTTLPTLSSAKAGRQHAASLKKPAPSRSSLKEDHDEAEGESKASKFGFKKKPAKTFPRGPRSTRPRNPRKTSEDGESSGSGYEEVGGGGYSDDDEEGYGGSSDSEGEMDITAALSGGMPSSSKMGGKGKERSKLPSQDAIFHAAGGKKKGSQYVPGQEDDDEEDGDVSDGDLIVEMMEKKNLKDGKAVVKSAVSKKGDNGKNVKEATGGGSFQSMGEFHSCCFVGLGKGVRESSLEILN